MKYILIEKKCRQQALNKEIWFQFKILTDWHHFKAYTAV